jgi:hypothetical protein
MDSSQTQIRTHAYGVARYPRVWNRSVIIIAMVAVECSTLRVSRRHTSCTQARTQVSLFVLCDCYDHDC